MPKVNLLETLKQTIFMSVQTKAKLQQRLLKIEKELESIRGKEYDLPFGSMRRAKVSRKWDMLAQEKMLIIEKLSTYEDN
jgi:uncharacterized protein YxjI